MDTCKDSLDFHSMKLIVSDTKPVEFLKFNSIKFDQIYFKTVIWQ